MRLPLCIPGLKDGVFRRGSDNRTISPMWKGRVGGKTVSDKAADPWNRNAGPFLNGPRSGRN